MTVHFVQIKLHEGSIGNQREQLIKVMWCFCLATGYIHLIFQVGM